MASKPLYRRKWVNLTLGLVVTFGCLAWAFLAMARDQPPGDVFRSIGNAFGQADYRTLPVMWGLVFLFYWLKAGRWTVLLRPLGDYTHRQTFPPVMIGFAFNNLLPAHLGEFVRVYVFARKEQLPQAAVLSSVVLERIFDILAILVFFLTGLVFIPDLDPEIRGGAWTFSIVVGVALLGAAAYLAWTEPFVRLVESILARMRFIPESLRAKVCHLMETGADGLAALKRGPLVARISLNSLVQWGLNGLVMHISLWSFGIEVSPLASCLLLGVVAFGVTIPSSPGYFGVINLLFIAVINKRTVGVDNEPAVFAASIYYHMSQYIPVTLAGLYFFNRTGLSVTQVEEQAEQVEDPVEPPDEATLRQPPSAGSGENNQAG